MRRILILFLMWPFLAQAKDIMIDVTSGGQQAVGTLLQVITTATGTDRQAVYDALAWRIPFSGMFVLRDAHLLPESVLQAATPNWRYLRESDSNISLVLKVYLTRDETKTRLRLEAWTPDKKTPTVDRTFATRSMDPTVLYDSAINRLYEQLVGHIGPFGETLFFQYRPPHNRQKELYRIRLGGLRPVQATRGMRIAMLPRSSPDGHSIAFIGYRNARPEVWELIPTTGQIRLAIPNSAPAYGAVRGSDGALYYSHAKGRFTEIRRSTASGSQLLVGGRSMNLGIDLAKDDQFAVFTSDRYGNPHIFRLDRLSPQQKPVRLTWDGEYNASPRISPDGKWIAFARREGDQFSIFAIDHDGKQLRKLTNNDGSDEDPAWSRDGRTIYFSSDRHRNRNNGTDLYTVDFWTGKVNHITTFKGEERMPEPLRIP